MCIIHCSTQRHIMTMFPLIPLKATWTCYCSQQNCTRTDDCAATIQCEREHQLLRDHTPAQLRHNILLFQALQLQYLNVLAFSTIFFPFVSVQDAVLPIIYFHDTRWFKYDRDYLCVNKSQFVPVIFEPPCIQIIFDIIFPPCLGSS